MQTDVRRVMNMARCVEGAAYLVLLDRHIAETKASAAKIKYQLATVVMDENAHSKKQEVFMLLLNRLMDMQEYRIGIADLLRRK